MSATLRLLPRVLNLVNPFQIVSRLRGTSEKLRGSRSKVGRERQANAERALDLIDDAVENGCLEALALRAEVNMFPPRGIAQNLTAAYEDYESYLDGYTSDPKAQFMLGFFYATGLGGAPRDQARALLYYTFSALQGYKAAQMAMGYRYWSGIAVKEDCDLALDYYESAARNALYAFNSGPPGGKTLLLSPSRLSDRYGGIFGPHASWASTGVMAHRAAVKASQAKERGENEAEILEFYQYRSDRGSLSYTYQLGLLFYLGSVYGHGVGVSSGAEVVGEVPRDYAKAQRYLYHVVRQLWPADFDAEGKIMPKKKMSKESEDAIRKYAMSAASLLGRMALRGEGMQQDYRAAYLWYKRAAELGDPEAHNGLGIIYRDGLGVNVDAKQAMKYFKSAATAQLPEAQVNLGKLMSASGQDAIKVFEAGIRSGSPFEALYHVAEHHAARSRKIADEGIQDHLSVCGIATIYYKIVSEVGSWGEDFVGDADRAWARGETNNALVGWWLAAEAGSEIGQNNVAFLLSRGLGKDVDAPADSELTLWMRSAAQDNADAMVKVGDYYYAGLGPNENATAPELPTGEHGEPDYAKALAYYQTAADKQSAMAYWNLGYMYENGLGVPRDWHIAKRQYDLSYSQTPDAAYLPWLLSMCKLYLRSWWVSFRTGGAVPGLGLYDEDQAPQSLWEGLKGLVWPKYDGYVPEQDEEVEDYSGAGWAQQQGGGQAGDDEEFDEVDDIIESLVIIVLTGVIMVLFWIRGRMVNRNNQ